MYLRGRAHSHVGVFALRYRNVVLHLEAVAREHLARELVGLICREQ
jgi:hypothetical protein